MEEKELNIPLLQPGEKILRSAYLTPDGEIVFSSHENAIEVVLVEAPCHLLPGAAVSRNCLQRFLARLRDSRLSSTRGVERGGGDL